MDREKFLNYNQEQNENVKERYELAIGRIAQIADDSILEDPYRAYFVKISEVLLQLDQLWQGTQTFDLMEQKQWNQLMGSSDWAINQIPKDDAYRTILAILCNEITSKIADVYRGRLDLLTITAELFLEIYSIFQDEPSVKQVEQAMYWHNSDYADIFEKDVVERLFGVVPSYEEELLKYDFAEASWEPFLYRYGYKITNRNLKIAQEYSKLSSQQIEKMVDFVLEQYLAYQDCQGLQQKIVPICFDVGLERVAKRLIERLQEKEIRVAFCRMEDLCPELLYDRGYEKNKCPWMNRQYKERKIQVLRTQLEHNKKNAKSCLSPLILYSNFEEQREQNDVIDEIQKDYQKKMWKEYFEQQENVLYSYIPDKTCIIL